ncbi:hypothetical protein CUN61_23980 [Pseudomonas arsenicoxydans]|uniref:Uncharacterized protein n=1 Tax=Pseudomonas arsenicoxydans TaxID=702115 RepID=A0A4P6G7S4_9PSED|nr:hypothetical protein CUN61_23980 [Pseudomonas arsenicoxydans]
MVCPRAGSELVRELLDHGGRQRVRQCQHVGAHHLPGVRFTSIIVCGELIDLGDVVATRSSLSDR